MAVFATASASVSFLRRRSKLATALAASALLLALAPTVRAAQGCGPAQDAMDEVEHGRLMQEGPVDTAVFWELQRNLTKYREPVKEVAVKMVKVKPSEVQVEFAADVPANVREAIVGGDFVYWPHHPNNKSELVPFQDRARESELTGYFSASRSMFVKLKDGTWISLKMPTDYPHAEHQPSKADMREDVKFSVAASEYVVRKDKELGLPPELIIQRELAGVSALLPGTRGHLNGYTIRDMTPLMRPDRFFLPAFSIPFVGPEIAQRFGASYREFWGQAFAHKLGSSKAKMLLRYGLELQTPNPQNMLVELNLAGRPTGVMIIRDVVDTHVIKPVAEAIGESATLTSGKWQGEAMKTSLNPYAENSLWRLNEEGPGKLSPADVKYWTQLHDAGYIEHVQKELGVTVVEIPADVSTFDSSAGLQKLGQWLNTDAGRTAVTKYHERLKDEQRGRTSSVVPLERRVVGF
jgi:hypothetical protein